MTPTTIEEELLKLYCLADKTYKTTRENNIKNLLVEMGVKINDIKKQANNINLTIKKQQILIEEIIPTINKKLNNIQNNLHI